MTLRDHETASTITNDNPSISKAIIQCPKSLGDTRKDNFPPPDLVLRANRPVADSGENLCIASYIAAATAENTRRAYCSDLRAFLPFAGALPATPESVASYLAAQATILSPVTLSRR